jgi:class 3 adenylate cyclase
MLFGDIKGFSKLDDRQLPIFVQDVLGAMATVLERYSSRLCFRNTWGDGIYLVFDDLLQAAHCALDLQAAITELPLNELGLPDHISLRLGGHYGPVYESADPILRNRNFFGAHVSRAARIEPITPEGCVYVTEHFAAALEVDARDEFSCNYVGTVPAAKGYGNLAMYLLRGQPMATTTTRAANGDSA